jgi:glycine/D-amino acid oxidase-like deaminating enzyme
VTNTPIWDDQPWQRLAALTNSIETDVCVIGLGGSGLTCINALLAHGLRVVGIDAGRIGGGAAGRNGGFLLAGMADFYHDVVAMLGREQAKRIYIRTLDEMRRIAAECPDLVRITGSLRIAASDDEVQDCVEQLAAMRADGLPVEPYDGPEGCGLLVPTDGTFQPLARCRQLAAIAQAAGGHLFEQTAAVDLSGNLVVTPQGRVQCQHVVVAVDGGLEQILPELTGRVRSGRLQMLATVPTNEVQIARPIYYRWGYEYWQQLPNGSIALGGFRDVGGADEWAAPAVPSEQIQTQLERFLRHHVRVQAAISHRWAAQVSFSDAQLPLVEQVRPGVWAMGAYNGTGNVLGAMCGRAVAEAIMSGESVIW